MPNGEVKVTLIKDNSTRNNTSSERSITESETASSISNPIIGRVTRLASIAALSKVAFDLAKKSYEKINLIEREGRVTTEQLRNYGGEGWSVNTMGDRFNVFGKRIEGESVAYKR